MSSIDTALYTRLSGFAGLSALVSTRIYPPPIPEVSPTYPLVTYQQISGPRWYAMGGETGLVEARFQVDAWSETSTGARSVAEQVRLALSGYSGTSDTIVINVSLMENELRDFDDSANLHRISQDYMVTYRESIP